MNKQERQMLKQKIWNEYKQSNITIEKLAEKYDMHPTTIAKWFKAIHEEWKRMEGD